MSIPLGYRKLDHGEIMTDQSMYWGARFTLVSLKEHAIRYVGQPWSNGLVSMYVPTLTPGGNIINDGL